MVAALAAGFLLGLLRPWHRAGYWAADQVRFTGPWVRGDFGRQTVVVLVNVVTAPCTSWRLVRASASETRAPNRPYVIRTGSPTAPRESTSRR
ncbi:hypothetical protein ACH4TI_33895 [Streptomyces rochei]|uniref:hypothetical protein n=1 Tax=Streptomyces rochei TaxID=1928 RepID=UPI00379663FE